jgi:hypothetical protein
VSDHTERAERAADWPISHALDRLLAQDSLEWPYVKAARDSLDSLRERLDAAEKALERIRSATSPRARTGIPPRDVILGCWQEASRALAAAVGDGDTTTPEQQAAPD